MAKSSDTKTTYVDDKSAFVVIESILTALARIRPSVADAEAAWESYIATKGVEQAEYLRSIRRSGHSIFYEMHQEVYEFCIEKSGLLVTSSRRSPRC